RFVTNNPISHIDPSGLFEVRVGTEQIHSDEHALATHNPEKFGAQGGIYKFYYQEGDGAAVNAVQSVKSGGSFSVKLEGGESYSLSFSERYFEVFNLKLLDPARD